MDKIELKLKACHFRNSTFVSNDDCVIAKVIRRKFKVHKNNISVKTFGLSFNGTVYDIIPHYSPYEYRTDYKIAEELKFNREVIRTVTLIKR